MPFKRLSPCSTQDQLLSDLGCHCFIWENLHSGSSWLCPWELLGSSTARCLGLAKLDMYVAQQVPFAVHPVLTRQPCSWYFHLWGDLLTPALLLLKG